VNIAVAHHNIANMDADSNAYLPLIGAAQVAFLQGALNLDGAFDCGKRAGEFQQEPVPCGFHFAAVVRREDIANDAPVFFEQFQRQCFIALGQRAEAGHVGEHDRRQLALLGIMAHSEWRED
jgi:hypothetical protein